MLIQSLCDYRCQQRCVTLCQSLSKVDGNFRSVHKKVTDHACHVPPVIHGPCPLAHQLMFMVGMLTMSKWFPSKKIVPGKTLVLLSHPVAACKAHTICASCSTAFHPLRVFHGFATHQIHSRSQISMYGGYDAGASQFAGGGFMPRSGFVFRKL